jgi:hypothetical protein
MRYPLVLDLAADGVPVVVTCRVLGFSKQAFYAWRADPDRMAVQAFFDCNVPVQVSFETGDGAAGINANRCVSRPATVVHHS